MMHREARKSRLALSLYMAGAALIAVCGCSGYFTPWSAFQPIEYDLGTGTFVPEATPLLVPDSINAGAGLTAVTWFSFAASKDTTYVIKLYPQFDNAALDIFDTASQSSVASVTDTSITTPVSVTWICSRTGTYYLSIRRDSSDYYGYASGPGPFRLSLKSFETAYGSVIDAYEPDSIKSLATRISYISESGPELFQFHRLTENDTDWYVFSPNYAHTYVIRTVGNADTRICLMAQAKDTIEASDDNSGGGKNARLLWTCPYSSGLYTRYFYVTGATTGVYGISITDQGY
jgi:hypothetical protein